MYKLLLLLLLPFQLLAQPFSKKEITDWQKRAKQINIIRDNWGIPHIYGKTDADAVFGLMYAQCEDDFKRVELNYIEKLGRLAELKGENELTWSLANKIIFDSAEAINDYNKAPAWLQHLCNSFAEGINFYIYNNPSKPALLTRFKPWYPLLWTDGSINAVNTADISQNELKDLYLGTNAVASHQKNNDEEILTGSNGFAFAPKITASGNAILYINPHVTFYFRPEVHMVSEEGLNAYGAVTWGQFFVYQGFNEHCGWMHTSSGVDAADSYIEKLSKTKSGWLYEYNHQQKKVTQKNITLNFKKDNTVQTKTVTVLYTHHGPILAKRNGKMISLRADNRILNGLIQCWQRTKATGLADFKKTLDLKGNISNNTVYADGDGNIGYWHGNRIPKRDAALNWNLPADGTNPSTEWKGYHTISEIVQSINPVNGWLQNCNATPFTVAGINSPKKQNYPSYMAPDGENYRGINAVKVLDREKAYTIDKVIAAGYDTYLPAFEKLVPALVKAFEKNVSPGDSLYTKLLAPVTILKTWDLHCGVNSIATTLAVEWGQLLVKKMNEQRDDEEEYQYVDQVTKTERFAAKANPEDLLQPLLSAINDLQNKFGKWQLPWGDINRFQRISSSVDDVFDDNKPSFPVGFASSAWGMLPSYASRNFNGSKKRYGVNGNSFICAVEFGKTVKARSLLAGGESGDETSPHFFDQGEMYSKGIFKDVLFYKDDVLKHVEKWYHPGE